MAQMNKKRIQKSGVTKSGFNGGQASGGGISRTQGKKRQLYKDTARAAIRVGTLGMSYLADEAVKKAREKKKNK